MSISENNKPARKYTDAELKKYIDLLYGKQVITPAFTRDTNTDPEKDWIYCWLKRQINWIGEKDSRVVSILLGRRVWEVRERKG